MALLHYQEPPRDIFPKRVSTTPRKASLTRHGTRVNHACSPSTSSELHFSEPCLTRHGSCVNHACPPSVPFTLDVELGRETVFHSDLATLVLHTLVETSLIARISIVHQSPKPKPQRQGSIELHLVRRFQDLLYSHVR